MKKLLILLLTLQTTAVYADEIDTEFVKRFSTLPTYSNAQISLINSEPYATGSTVH